MLKHIIVEGCDGSGKTTLVTKLSHALGWPVHERASTSLGGPVTDVDLWALNDVNTMDKQPNSIYDRHPIISEVIYAPLVRKVKPAGMFDDPSFGHNLRTIAATHALLVVCFPQYSFVRRNVFEDGPGIEGQMAGVQDNLRELYNAYKYVGSMWPTQVMWWNGWQSSPYDFNKLVSDIRARFRGEFDA